jgi:pimeloyl-ACP methyl ester carboxylesterase
MNMSLQFLERPEGRIAYDVTGEGPLVVCLAGMGDLRSTWRHLVPTLLESGFRVATMELRGHGDSDTTFTSYDNEAAASDLLSLISELGGPALVVGHSMGTAASIVAAADDPTAITGLVLVGAFAREPKLNPVLRALMTVATQGPWLPLVWKSYLPGLYAGQRAADHDQHIAATLEAIGRPGHRRAFSRTLRTSHEIAEQRIGQVTLPSLVVMGELDPDFKDPAAEARWIAERLGSEILMVPEAGHYPHSQRSDLVTPAVVAFAQKVSAGA